MKYSISHQKRRLLLALSVLLILGFLTTSLVSYYVSRATLRDQISTMSLPLTSDNVYTEIQRDLLRPVFISSLMANDTFLKDWIISGEKDKRLVAKYLKEIMQKYGTFTSFFVSESTQIYYHANGVLKKINRNEKRDAWYYRLKEQVGDYEINVDPDMANSDAMTIFINHKVFDYEGRYIGSAGVGLTTNAVIDLINSYGEKYHSNIYFIDQEGRIVLYGDSFRQEAETLYDMAELAPFVDQILGNTKHSFEFRRQGRRVQLNTRFVPELNWMLFVEQVEGSAATPIHHALWVNLGICALITAVVFLLTRLTVNAFQSVNEKQHDELREKNTALALAVSEKSKTLDRNRLLMSEMHHRIKNNLTIIQSLLRLQSSRMEEGGSRSVLTESESRVRSIRNIHHLLSKGVDLKRLNVASYLNNLIRDVAAAFKTGATEIDLDIRIEEIDLDIDLLIPMALILNELMTNAFKYAFDGQPRGLIEIALNRIDGNHVQLRVQDNGKGLPEGFDLQSQDSLGVNILLLLSEQLDGDLRCSSEPGQGAGFILNVPCVEE